MIRKITAGITTVLALAVTVVTAVVVAEYWHTANRSDRIMIMLPPIIIPLVLAGIGLIATLSSVRSGKKNGWMIGFCLGATLYLIFPAMQLLLQYDMVRHDGTGFLGGHHAPFHLLRNPTPLNWRISWPCERPDR